MSERAPMRIYVASLSDYTAGRLHGVHIDVEGVDAEEIREKVQQMLARSPEPGAEEWAIHDYEGFGKWRLGEWESFDSIAMVGQVVATLPEGDVAPFLYWYGRAQTEQRIDPNDYHDDPDGLEQIFREEYKGDWSSWLEYVRDSEYGEMFLGLDHLRQAAKADDESRRYMGGPSDACERLMEDLIAYIDWDKVARTVETDNSHDIERHDGGVWVFEDQS